jgi:phosphatidylinositol kinase/protein kinase (PI-3  family)
LFLLQEQLAVSFIAQLGRIWSQAKLPLRLRPYTILATSPTAGLIQVVPDAKSIDSIIKV